MLKHRNIDRVCCIVLALVLLITCGYLGAGASGLIASQRTLGYENRLFDTARVHTIDIVMEDWEGFLATCTDEEYVPCHVVIDGESYKNVAIRAKGNTSLSSVQQYGNNRYSFKIEFDHYQPGSSYHGLDKLSLNNLIQDNTYLKDYLAYTLMRKGGAAAPLCSFVQINVNGQPWGLYLAVEGVEDSFLRRNYGNDTGDLYKPDSMSFGGGRGNGKGFDMDDFRQRMEQDTEAGEESSDIPGGGQWDWMMPEGMQMPEGFALPEGGATMPGGFTPSEGEEAMPSGFTPPEGSETMPSGFTPPEGDIAMPSGFTPSEGEEAMPSGFTPPEGSETMPGGFTPPEGGMEMPSDFTPPEGGMAMPSGFTTPEGGMAMPSGFTPPEGGMAMPSGFTPSEGGATMPGGFTPSEGGMEMPGEFVPSDNTAGSESTGEAVSGATKTSNEDRHSRRPSGGFGGFGGFGGMGGSDVQLQYSDDDPDSYSNIFNNAKTDVTDADQQRLIASLKALSQGDTSVVDTDAVIRYLAVHSFLCNDDSYTGMMVHNYYLYEKDGVLSMLPWDYNLAFGGFGMGGGFGGSGATSTVNQPIDSPVTGGNLASRPMVSWIFDSEETVAAYHDAYSQFISEAFESGWFADELQRVVDLIAPYVESDPTAFCSYEEFQTGVETLREFCLLRAQSVRGQLDGTIPATSEGQRNADTLVDASHLNLSEMGSMGSMGGGGPMGGGAPTGSRPSSGEQAGDHAKGDAFTSSPVDTGRMFPEDFRPADGPADGTGWGLVGISLVVLLAAVWFVSRYRSHL